MTSRYRAAQRAVELVARLQDEGLTLNEIAAEMRRLDVSTRQGGNDPAADLCASVQDMVADFAKALGQPPAEESALRRRAEAAEQRADLYGRFVQESGFLVDIEVYSPDDLPYISERLGALHTRAEAAEQRAEAAEAKLAAMPRPEDRCHGEWPCEASTYAASLEGEVAALTARAEAAEAERDTADLVLRSADELLSEGLSIVLSLSDGYNVWIEQVCDHLSPDPHPIVRKLAPTDG